MISDIRLSSLNNKYTPQHKKNDVSFGGYQETFARYAKKVGEGGIKLVQQCEKHPMINVTVLDLATAIIPRTLVETFAVPKDDSNKKTEDKLQQDQQLRNVKLADSSDTTKKIEASVAALEASFSKGTDEEAETSEFHPKLLVEDIPAKELEVNNSIKFASGVDTLSSEQMSQINSIIGGFKDIEHNKIAIYSYNQDDGVDSFKKKRISLNRAIEVRSYLIKQGYKNFSIKVININSGSDKIDTVEIEEL